MAIYEARYPDGSLAFRMDDGARTIFWRDPDGTVHSRAYTNHENEEADQRALNAAELGVKLTLEQRAETAIDLNKAFLDLASPSNAELLQHIRSITRQNNALIRLLLKKLDSAD